MFSFISNTLEEFLDKFEKAPADLQTYLSSGLLLGTADKQPTLINKCKFSYVECCQCHCRVMLSCASCYAVNAWYGLITRTTAAVSVAVGCSNDCIV